MRSFSIDFITIHVTFPTINAWISYNLYFSLMISVATVCNTEQFNSFSGDWCDTYNKGDLKEEQKYVYFYGKMVVPSICVFALMFVEASVNLTYYKDCVFASTVFLLYLGMLWVNYEFKLQVQNYDSAQSTSSHHHTVRHHSLSSALEDDDYSAFTALPSPIEFFKATDYRVKTVSSTNCFPCSMFLTPSVL